MSNKTKWKWIAQDKYGAIYKYEDEPLIKTNSMFIADIGHQKLVQVGIEGRTRDDWKESLINLETHDYKIIDGVLIKVDKMEETKWKWIAQDKDGSIGKYSVFPDLRKKGWYAEENEFALIDMGFSYEVNGWKESLINLETHDYKIVDGILIRVDKEDKQQKHQHYKKDVKHLDYIDVYRIIDLYELHDPCFQHALKKILVPGARGHKDLTKDINDIIDTMQRKLEMIAENENKL